jgi:hypothetical protein
MCRRMTTSRNDICRRQIFSFFYTPFFILRNLLLFFLTQVYASSEVRIWLGLLGPTLIRGSFACLIKKKFPLKKKKMRHGLSSQTIKRAKYSTTEAAARVGLVGLCPESRRRTAHLSLNLTRRTWVGAEATTPPLAGGGAPEVGERINRPRRKRPHAPCGRKRGPFPLPAG